MIIALRSKQVNTVFRGSFRIGTYVRNVNEYVSMMQYRKYGRC
jgi:hypothetical protein